MNKARIAHIDIMKGFGILSVLIGHYVHHSIIPTVIWSFHMPLFVLLSGYLYKRDSLKNKIVKAASSYLKPYVIVWLILIVSECIIALLGLSNNTPISAIKTRTISGLWALASNNTPHRPYFVIKIGVIWFLNSLFIGTIIFSLILRIKKNISQTIIILLLTICASVQTYTICIPLGINYGILFLIYLAVGYHYRSLKDKKSKIIDTINSTLGMFVSTFIWIIIVSIEILSRHNYNIIYPSFSLYGLEIVGAIAGTLTTMHLSVYITKLTTKQPVAQTILVSTNNVLQYIGRSTIWIMCIHAIDIELLPNFIDTNDLTPTYKIIVISIRIFSDIFIALTLRQVWHNWKSLGRPHLLSKK